MSGSATLLGGGDPPRYQRSRRQEPVAMQASELALLEALQRHRPLTSIESERLANLVYRAGLRARRINGQIEAARAKLARLEGMADG